MLWTPKQFGQLIDHLRENKTIREVMADHENELPCNKGGHVIHYSGEHSKQKEEQQHDQSRVSKTVEKKDPRETSSVQRESEGKAEEE
jgi:hypothetical protein